MMARFELFLLNHWQRLLKITVAIVVIGIVLNEGSKQIAAIDLFKTLQQIRETDKVMLMIFILGGVAASSTMVLYDVIVVNYFKLKIPHFKLWRFALLANTMNNLLGMGGLAGVAIRAAMINGTEDAQGNKGGPLYYNVVLAPSTPTGLSILAMLALLEMATAKGLVSHFSWLYLALFGMSLYLPVYLLAHLVIDRFKDLKDQRSAHREMGLKFKLVLASTLEWLAAAAFLWLIIRMEGVEMPLSTLVILYTISAIAGMISFVPGGLGSFDLVMLIGLDLYGVDSAIALAALVLFRLFYYLLPGLISAAFFILSYGLDLGAKLGLGQKLKRIGVFNHALKRFESLNDLVNLIMAFLVSLSGVILLGSAIKPGIPSRFEIISHLLSPLNIRIVHSISILMGFLLIWMSFEIFYKVNRAYFVTLGCLLLGGFATLFKGLDFEEFIFLMCVAILLKVVKPSFYRHSMPLRFTKFVFMMSLGLIGISAYNLVNQKLYQKYFLIALYPESLFDTHDKVVFHNVLISLAFIVVILVLWLTRRKMSDIGITEYGEVKLMDWLKTKRGDALTHLFLLPGKFFYLSPDEEVLFAYSKFRNVIVVLGDPIGEPGAIGQGLKAFLSHADAFGYEVVFYEVSQPYMAYYHDFGYHFFKLGEEASVNLKQFHLNGGSKAKQRYIMNQFQKSGYQFEVISPPHSEARFAEMKAISDAWLKGRPEMGFSLGYFDQHYLNQSDIALLLAPDGSMIGFISLMKSFDQGLSRSTDLMRFSQDVPHGTMDFMMLSLMTHLKHQGYEAFSLGMAPLSNVGKNRHAHLGERMANQVFKHGSFHYNFEGLRKYKEKFEPEWQARYLAYPQLLSLPVVLLEVSMLIASGGRGKKA